MIAGVEAKKKGWKVLIVDQDSMRIISSAVRMFDVMEKDVAC